VNATNIIDCMGNRAQGARSPVLPFFFLEEGLVPDAIGTTGRDFAYSAYVARDCIGESGEQRRGQRALGLSVRY
jgi:hypothetical protein